MASAFSMLFLVASFFLFITFSYAQMAPVPSANGGCYLSGPQECQAKCEYRCSATSHKKPCMFYCMECCNTCVCVPPGTYGNKECCPCYNNWMTKRGTPKCP